MSQMKPSRRKTGTFLIWGALALVLILIGVFTLQPKPQEEAAIVEEKAVPVRVTEVIPQQIADEIQLPARIEPLQEAYLAAERPGRVMELLTDKGASAEKNQVLLQFDRRLPEAALRRAEIEERDAARDLARWKQLEKAGAVSASEYEAVSRREESAAIALEEAKVILSQCEIRSPFEGVIMDRMVEVGDYANEGQAVLRLIRLDRVKVAFDVPEQDVSTLASGQERRFTLAALPGREFSGEVVFVSSQASRDSNAFRVELVAENKDGALKAGMIARVFLLRQMREGAVVVPLAAIVPRKGEHYVFVMEDGRAVRKRVLIAAMLGHEAVLEGGVSAGDRIVVEGHRGLQDGQKVAVAGAPADTPSAELETVPEE
jgi:membrane fusion protein, multidrug efflux system